MNYYHEIEQFWNQTFIDSYVKLLSQYQDKIITFAGAHIHTGNIRAPNVGYGNSTVTSTILVNPALSPIYDNNPCYGILDIDETDLTVTNYYWRFF